MPHEHKHSGHQHHANEPPRKRAIHRDWRFWAVLLMLGAMGVYVATMDEAIGPGGEGQPVPAAAE